MRGGPRGGGGRGGHGGGHGGRLCCLAPSLKFGAFVGFSGRRDPPKGGVDPPRPPPQGGVSQGSKGWPFRVRSAENSPFAFSERVQPSSNPVRCIL